MVRQFVSAVFCLLLLSGKATAGWYHVENYEGSIGPNPAHLSLQTYTFGSSLTVEGSYFYDDKQSPIPLYGKISGTSIALCEIADDEEFQRVIVMGSKTPADTTGCPFSLELADGVLTGSWSKGADKFPVNLKKVAGLDDTGEGKIDGSVEIPFWAQTATDRFAGVYTKTDNGICMTKMQVINKKRQKVVQTIKFGGDLCNAGMLMTPIYFNVQKSVERGKDIISVSFYDGRAGYEEDYVFDRKTRKYRLRK
ncbi:hypothetical protein NLY43_04775 [Mesorhizobium sp. C416B]|uniref:hypothetical protein n=1 Tax=unclassified Mesorhizobium TaxID=325217 RepID=UPI0003CE1C65|nr:MULTISPECIES: hypothetical protein [unclassified Mesorhizobium]ESX40152.1 hypothetical protein X762_31625 [Mesorhizobium sp. LSHC426A00]ESX47886.1 hypothetical protein X761_28685 [Mesorhizobium sp. LSHC424B00]ESY03502.1 hypothetical protein X753_20780 [Mesorhizobium sp. LNJC399B00]WJI64083.1 hypothetical protein NLY43_04775 [Mesorhizobium sp. C416B]WJI68766.1 hypothetical protein NLY36_28985 [Mesorhizobium sp. C399B]